MYHLVYMTTNLVNGKIYVGVHSTLDVEDGYLGSGNLIKKAVKKYGRENFDRKILYFCLCSNDALDLEAMIVSKGFVAGEDTYNLKLGGVGSCPGENNYYFGKVKPEETRRKISATLTGKPLAEATKKKISETTRGRTKSTETKLRMVVAHQNLDPEAKKERYRKVAIAASNISEETKVKRSIALSGELNGMYGKVWVNKEGERILVSKEEIEGYLSTGWERGMAKGAIPPKKRKVILD